VNRPNKRPYIYFIDRYLMANEKLVEEALEKLVLPKIASQLSMSQSIV